MASNPGSLQDLEPGYAAQDDFMQLVQAATSEASDVVALIEAYFDESYGEGGVMCVAGYAFTKIKCGEFDKQWRNMLRRYELPFFRMSACAHGKRPFDRLTPEQRIAVEKEAIGLIKRYAACGFAITVDPDDFDRYAKQKGLLADPYELCVWLGVLTVRNWLEDSGMTGSVAYFFEAGHSCGDRFNAMMTKAVRDERLAEICMYRSHSFVRKVESRPCQAADLLAWQWFTDKKRHGDPRFSAPRKDLQSLIEARHNVVHADPAFLQDMMHGLAKMYGPRSA